MLVGLVSAVYLELRSEVSDSAGIRVSMGIL